MSFTISNDLFSAQAECTLTSFQLKSSSLVQNFCSEAIAWAPLCGMMLGRIAAPLVRFRSAQLFNSFGFNQTFSRFTSWGIGVSAEGTIMAAAPGVLMGQGLSPDIWRGSVHGTFTMMMAQGVARGIPMNGIIREVSQDLSFMAVNVFCGEVGVTDKVNGSFMEQYCEARIVSVRMKISGELVHATCVEATYAQAKIEVQRKVEESIQRDSRGWEGVLQEVTQLTEKSQLVDPYGRIAKGDWESPEQEVFRKTQTSFMTGGSSERNSYSYEQIRGFTLQTINSLGPRKNNEVFQTLYEILYKAKKRVVETLEEIDIPDQLMEEENLTFCHNPYSNYINEWFPKTLRHFGEELNHHFTYQKLTPFSPLGSVIDSFLVSKFGVTTPEGVKFLRDQFLRIFPEATLETSSDKRTIMKIPHPNGVVYTIIIHANRKMRTVKIEEGITNREMLRLQDEENDRFGVILVKSREGELIIRGSVSRAGLDRRSGDILIAHTHPWDIEKDAFVSTTPGKREIEISQEINNTQLGIYRTTLLVFHPNTQILPLIFGREDITDRRGNITYIPFALGEDFIISADGNNVLIWPHPDHPIQDRIEVYPIVDVGFCVENDTDTIFTDGEGHLVNRQDLVKKVTREV